MTQPTPQPAPTPAPSGGSFGGITLTVPDTKSKSQGDLYGVGQWGSQPVDAGDLPFVITAKGNKPTADDVIKAFAGTSDPQVIAQIQQALYLGGYYSSTYTPTWGVIKPEDVSAFGNATILAGQQGASVSSVLLQGAQYGTAAGVAAAKAAAVPASKTVAEVRLPNTTDLEALAIKTAQQALGHKMNPQEAAAFAAAFRAYSAGIQRAANENMFAAQTNAYEQHAAAKAGKSGTSGQAVAAGASAPPANFADPTSFDAMPPGATPVAPNFSDPTSFDALPPGATAPAGGSAQAGAQGPSFAEQMATLGQVAAQAQSQALTGAQPTLTQVQMETPMDPAVAAENYARNTHPDQAAAKDVSNVFSDFLSLLSGHFGG